MGTAERLAEYGVFEDAVIDRIAEVDEFQRSFESHQKFIQAVGGSELVTHLATGYHPIQVVDFIPKGDYDEKQALVYDLPMANAANSNQLFQVATIAAARPDRRIVVTSNPSAGLGGRFDSGRLNYRQRRTVASGDIVPTVIPTIDYLQKNGIERADHIGYSYGSDKALAAARTAEYAVENIVTIEPASTIRRAKFVGRLTLALAFGSTKKALAGYNDAPDLEIFRAARQDETRIGDLAYVGSLFKLSNLAIAKSITKGHFETSLRDALRAQPEATATVSWGDESELSEDATMQNIVQRIDEETGRVYNIRIAGGRHALANDVHLQAAIVHQALQRSAA